MEYKIGERFPFRGVMLEVALSCGCGDCIGLRQDGNEACNALPDCLFIDRKDKTDVSFVLAAKGESILDEFGRLIKQAEEVAKLEQTPEQRLVSNEAVDRLVALRDRLGAVTLAVEAK